MSSNLLSQSYHWDTLQTIKKDMFSLNKHMDALRYISQWMEDEGHDDDHAYMDTMLKMEEEVAKVVGIGNEVIHASRPAPVPVIQAQAQTSWGAWTRGSGLRHEDRGNIEA